MKFLMTIGLILFVTGAWADTDSTERELRELLDAFMAGASANDAEIHDRFWADDLVYTSSAGQRFGKEHIMSGLADADPADEAASVVYSARDVQVRLFDGVAVVTFRLVADLAGEETRYFFNTGVFEIRDGRWQAVAWQATHAADASESD